MRGVDLSGNIGPWNAEGRGVRETAIKKRIRTLWTCCLEENPYLHEGHRGDLNERIDPIEFDLEISIWVDVIPDI